MLDNGDNGNDQFPLAGVILCCTAIPPEERSKLADIACQMGASHKLDLTSDVTHLIVGKIDTPKYRYVARERPDVVVITPPWLEAVRISWMEGGHTDVAALSEQYRVPPLHGLKICVTGFDDLSQRQNISETINRNGAEYHGDLTKSITHLIAASPTGKKYQYALSWQIKVVCLEWLEHSLKRGMMLEEQYYDPTLAPEKRGVGALKQTFETSPVLGKRARDVDQSKKVGDQNARRKLRRSASSKLGSQNESIWADITAGGSIRQQEDDDEWQNDSHVGPEAAHSIVHETKVIPLAEPDNAQRTSRASTSKPPQARSLLRRERNGIFQGRVMFVHGFDNVKAGIVRETLSSNGADVIRSAGELQDPSQPLEELQQGFVVVPHDMLLSDLPTLPETADQLCKVTNWWVEKCLEKKGLVFPSEYVLGNPFDRLSIEGFSGMIISTTSFAGIEVSHVSKFVNLMGARYDGFLTPATSVLVCNTQTPRPEKLKFAAERKIPVVTAAWLWDSLAAYKVQPYDPYITPTKRRQGRNATAEFTEVPTARLSKEDSEELVKRNRQNNSDSSRSFSKLPPKGRNSSKTTAALEFALSNDHTPASTEGDNHDSSPASHGDFASAPESASASGPLQELAPEMNSPRRPSTTSTHSNSTGKDSEASSKQRSMSRPAERQTSPEKQPTPDSVIPPDSLVQPDESHQETLNTAIADLLARKKAASAAQSIAAQHDPPRNRRRSKLGRATSGTSNPSTAASHPNSIDEMLNANPTFGGDGNDDGLERDKSPFVEYQPSQSLLYEGPEVQKAREQMIRQMGGKVEEVSGVVGPIGVVKDMVSEGIGGRVGGRRRRM